MHLEQDLPKEFEFLRIRKEQLIKEVEQIEAMEQNLIETRQLMARAMNYIGCMSQEEFANAEGGKYMKLFLEGKLEEAAAAHLIVPR